MKKRIKTESENALIARAAGRSGAEYRKCGAYKGKNGAEAEKKSFQHSTINKIYYTRIQTRQFAQKQSVN